MVYILEYTGLRADLWPTKQEADVKALGGVSVGFVLAENDEGRVDPPSFSYARGAERDLGAVGIEVDILRGPQEETPSQVEELVGAGKGVIIGDKLPYPDRANPFEKLPPALDIDASLPDSPFMKPTTQALFALAWHHGIDLSQPVVLGSEGEVGSRFVREVRERGGNPTTIDKKLGHTDDTLLEAVREADIVVTAMGVPGKLQPDWFKDGASVIDVAVQRAPDGSRGFWGDVHPSVFDSDRNLQVTPLGVVGPLSSLALGQNAIIATWAGSRTFSL